VVAGRLLRERPLALRELLVAAEELRLGDAQLLDRRPETLDQAGDVLGLAAGDAGAERLELPGDRRWVELRRRAPP
jgi:hypothetical protein